MCLILAKFDEINALRGSLPLVYIINDWNYDEMIWKFKNEGINELCKYLNKLITEKKINVMIFDNFQTVSINLTLWLVDDIYT